MAVDMKNVMERYKQQKEQQVLAEQNAQVARFCSNKLNSKFIFADGHAAEFINGVFYTSDEREYAELMNEIDRGHPDIYQEEGKELVSKEDMDPMAEVRRKAVEEYKAQLAAAQNVDAGKTKQGAALGGVGNTTNMGVMAASSVSGAGAGAVPAGSIKIQSATPSTAAAKATS